jgi:hypothetical protein
MILQFFVCPQPGQAGTKKELACPGNYKLQITNYKQRGVLRTNFKRLRRGTQRGVFNHYKKLPCWMLGNVGKSRIKHNVGGKK